MKIILTGILASFFSLLPGGSAIAESGAGVEFEVTGSHGYAAWDKGKEKFQTNEARVAVHKQLGDLPLSLGLSAGKLNIAAIPDSVGRAEGYDLAIEAKAWLPSEVTGSDNFRPFIRLAHTGYSQFELRAGGDKIRGPNEGLTAGLGALYRFTDSTGASLEYSYQQKAMKFSGQDRQGYKSHGITLGLAHRI